MIDYNDGVQALKYKKEINDNDIKFTTDYLNKIYDLLDTRYDIKDFPAKNEITRAKLKKIFDKNKF